MNEYKPRHAAHAEQADLPPAMRGLADKIQIVDSKSKGS